MATLINRKNYSTVVHAAANTTWQMSDFAVGTETVPTGVAITQVWFGSPSGNSAYWTVKRGANTVAVLDSTSYLDFAGNGCSLNLYPSANVTVTLIGATDGFIMLEVQKLNQTSDYLSTP
jgi:hypothetical protein